MRPTFRSSHPSYQETGGSSTMTLRQFETITYSVPPSALRRAMAAALAVEPVRSPEAYARFYGRVIAELSLPNTERTEAA